MIQAGQMVERMAAHLPRSGHFLIDSSRPLVPEPNHDAKVHVKSVQYCS